MKKLLVVAFMLTVFCGAAVADWQADFDAWKGQSSMVRFWDRTNAEGKHHVQRNVGINLIMTATPEQLDLMLPNVEDVVLNKVGNPTIYERAYAADLLIKIYRRQSLTDQARWTKIQVLAQLYTTPEWKPWALSGWYILVLDGKVAEAEKVITHEQFLALKTAMELAMPFYVRVQYFPERVTKAEVIAHIDANKTHPEKLVYPFRFLGIASAESKVTDAEYKTALENVLIASIARMATMEDGAEKDMVLKAVGGVKTVYEELKDVKDLGEVVEP